MAGYDPNLPVFDLMTFEEQVNQSVFADRLVTYLSTCLALLASLLAAVGLYGVMAYVVARRTREIGIRMALGATQKNVSWLILSDVIRMTLIGLAIGLPCAYAIGRLVQSLLYGVKASDPVVFLASALLLAAVTLLAGRIAGAEGGQVSIRWWRCGTNSSPHDALHHQSRRRVRKYWEITRIPLPRERIGMTALHEQSGDILAWRLSC